MALGLCAAVPACMNAQTSHPAHSDRSVEVLFNNMADSLKVFKAMNVNSPAAFDVSDAPRFAFVGKDNKFYVGIGATIKGTAGYDFGDPIANPNYFTTSAINMHPAPGNGGKFSLSAQQSSVFLNIVALPDNPNKIGLYASANLLGEGYGFKLKYAYLRYRGFEVGYDYTLFADMAAGVPTIDYEGPNSFTSIPTTVFNYRHEFGKKWSVGIGIETPIASYTPGSKAQTVSQRVPDIPAYVQYAWKEGSWLRFSAIMRNIAYRDLLTASNRNKPCWGIKLSGSAEIVPNLRAYYQGVFGYGVTSYLQDLYGDGLDLTPSTTTPGQLDAVKAWGAYGGLQYNFSPQVYCSATYSHLRNYAKKFDGDWGGMYRYGQYFVANVFYNINSWLTWGVEYLYGRRVNMDGAQEHDNRVQTMLQISL